MTDSENLTALLMAGAGDCLGKGGTLNCSKLADYLIEHGVIVLPCKVGDIVYVPYEDSQTIEEKRVKSISHVINESENSMEFNCKHNYAFLDTDINRGVFLSREEAEKALKERDGS